MPGFGSIMDSSLSGMFMARVALQTVSHNIANANTPGFSRQDVVVTARRALYTTYGALGRGVQVDQVRRLTDAFLQQRLRDQSAQLSSYDQVDSALSEIEAIFGSVDSDHLGTSLTDFFKAWSDLASPPTNETHKPAVASAAEGLVTDLRATASALTDLERSMNDGIAAELTTLNELLREVAELNSRILQVESTGASANDLRDQRDQRVFELSALTRVSTIERDDGTLDVIIKGRTVVVRDQAEQLELRRVTSAQGEQAEIVTQSSQAIVELDAGKLRGMIEARDTHISGARARLDDLARLLIDRVNAVHTQGRTGTSSGLLFFTGDSAATIALNPAIAANANLIASSRSGLDGDNDIAQEIAQLATAPLSAGGSESLLDRYNGLIVDLASKRGSYQFLLENQQNVVATLEGNLESIRGVSLDEEGANLVRYQNAYEASARVASTVAELFQTMLDMM